MPDPQPDRRHNREDESPEALRRSIDALTEAIATLELRLDEATLRLDGDIDGARVTTRRLATEVGRMGEALVRRIETVAPAPRTSKRRRNYMWPLAIALTLGVLLAIVGMIGLAR